MPANNVPRSLPITGDRQTDSRSERAVTRETSELDHEIANVRDLITHLQDLAEAGAFKPVLDQLSSGISVRAAKATRGGGRIG